MNTMPKSCRKPCPQYNSLTVLYPCVNLVLLSLVLMSLHHQDACAYEVVGHYKEWALIGIKGQHTNLVLLSLDLSSVERGGK